MERTVRDIIAYYNALYRELSPDQDSVNLTRDIWDKWEKDGVIPPNIESLAINNAKFQNGFFYDIVAVAEKMEQKTLNIHYCPFCLDSYNFYAFSAHDGYIVLVDDYFFQMLFFLCLLFIYDSVGELTASEKEEVKILANDLIINNYFNRRRYDFKAQGLVVKLLERDFEISEFVNYFYNCLKIFILSHEIGHHVLGHTTGKITRTFGISGNSSSIEVDNRDILKEFEADKYGYTLFDKMIKTVDEKIYYAFCKYQFDYAPLFLFDLFEKLDDLSASIDSKAISYETHPHPRKRKRALLKSFNIDSKAPLYLDLKKSVAQLSL